MYGAILGDIIGSRFEFDRGGLTKDFDLLTAEDMWTDDTVMTVAVAEALMDAGKDAGATEIEAACIRSMQKWGQRYPDAGYGARFIYWVISADPRPYGSYGNGSAMRVSAAGWLYDSIEKTREAARATASVSHDHPEGIKGAECTAAVIFMSRTGATKEEIADYVIKEFGYDFSESLKEMRARHEHVETCQDSLPKALRSFMDGESYEDVVRNAVSLGGDTDTLAAIAGAMAEAFYDMPLMLKSECRMRVEDDMLEVMKRFDDFLGRQSEENKDPYADNAPLGAALKLFLNEEDEKKRVNDFFTFLNIMAKRISEDAVVPMPFVDVNNVLMEGIDIDHVMAGDTVELQKDVRLRMDTMTDGEGNLWLPLFLNDSERNKGQTANVIMPVSILDVLKSGLHGEDLKGVVINPFGSAFTMTKDLLGKFIQDYESWAERKETESHGTTE
ncbi:MAG: ADP-ribosylglycohydrolase family protein [Lachnospiraceae bacterium]|nr:ADP-ribosylglycohydrolase family protein [Lachnospiraceae bacterium]